MTTGAAPFLSRMVRTRAQDQGAGREGAACRRRSRRRGRVRDDPRLSGSNREGQQHRFVRRRHCVCASPGNFRGPLCFWWTDRRGGCIRTRLRVDPAGHREEGGGRTASTTLKMAVLYSADAEGEREHCDGSETRGFVEHSNAEADVPQQLLKPNETPHLSRIFLDASHVSELAQSRITCFLRRHAATNILLCRHLDVVADLLVEILQHAFAPPHNWRSSVGRRIRAIAPASLSHLLVSSASCRQPFSVSGSNLARRLFSEVPSSTEIHLRFMSRCSAGYSDPAQPATRHRT